MHLVGFIIRKLSRCLPVRTDKNHEMPRRIVDRSDTALKDTYRLFRLRSYTTK